jgi:Dodecin
LRKLRIAEVIKQDMVISDGKVEAYRTKVRLSFKYEVMSKSKASQPTLRDRASAWPYLSGVVIWWSTRTVAALFKDGIAAGSPINAKATGGLQASE